MTNNKYLASFLMSETYITIQESAELTGKSIQTIRRAIKAKKLTYKRKKTPQGFHYMISRESVIEVYKLRIPKTERKQGSVKKTGKEVTQEFATIDDLKKIQADLEAVLKENDKAKESFMRFMKTFQEKFIVMENQLKLLEEPSKKKWYHFWK